MPRPCSACSSPNAKAISQKLRSGTTLVDIARWLESIGDPIGRNALSRHKPHIGVGPGTPGPRPRGGSFLQDVVEYAHADMASGVTRPTIREAVGASAELNRQVARQSDWEMTLKLAAILGGVRTPMQLRVIDPEVEEIENQYRQLLTAGDD